MSSILLKASRTLCRVSIDRIYIHSLNNKQPQSYYPLGSHFLIVYYYLYLIVNNDIISLSFFINVYQLLKPKKNITARSIVYENIYTKKRNKSYQVNPRDFSSFILYIYIAHFFNLY